jgi:hypothetical protein
MTTERRNFSSAEEFHARQEMTPLPYDADPYEIAQAVYEIRVEQLKAYGLLRRESEIDDEWEQEEHFDELAREYKEVCLRLGLRWPPLPVEYDPD